MVHGFQPAMFDDRRVAPSHHPKISIAGGVFGRGSQIFAAWKLRMPKWWWVDHGFTVSHGISRGFMGFSKRKQWKPRGCFKPLTGCAGSVLGLSDSVATCCNQWNPQMVHICNGMVTGMVFDDFWWWFNGDFMIHGALMGCYGMYLLVNIYKQL